ncbi:hypothetical protein JCM8202_005651 [Rhodotorula sphaerocarpa]
MLLGVGVDLLHLARLRSVLARRGPERLAARILSCSERVEWENLAEAGPVQRERFLALRWTAKEAAYKALYPSIVPRWADLSVSKSGPKPILAFSDQATFARSPSISPEHVRMHLSVSHDADLMVAYVVAETVG